MTYSATVAKKWAQKLADDNSMPLKKAWTEPEQSYQALSEAILNTFMDCILDVGTSYSKYTEYANALEAYTQNLYRHPTTKVGIYLCPLRKQYYLIDIDDARLAQLFRYSYRRLDDFLGRTFNKGKISREELDSLKAQRRNIRVSFYSFVAQQFVTPASSEKIIAANEAKKVRITKSTPLVSSKYKNVQLPPDEILTEFHVCGRKVLFVFENEAKEAAKREKLDAYKCVYCTGYHMGHPTKKEKDYSKITGSTFSPKHKRAWVLYPKKVESFLLEQGYTF